ncbi:MAG TPA: tRNA pseudouridine(38-40) synthase TruA [Firmicutes bacterium]|nr:tRNA pseudouridine(38-40) synthase TruA [Bacillota bacterium]HAW70351.1 tRNA pseudouridine(38-40) synthase TruA [Bacillota bacterium]HAZ21094.1 tRNA pseudouridine(38-40) synthase TruA [Bacillota bacterium]HBE05479.1 tRNA pseudouridine(38-40) synthase TruA [Bacillota bacterium]HBG45141.1 tRNA pseudouridine(38-40) synthase TruA [Bacillota bacterium]
MRTLLITVAYDGTDYAGFQIQLNGNTIQEEIEKALHKLTGVKIRITGSGRTDAGVHASGQAISFDTESTHEPATFLRALNAMLPRDIAVLSSEEAPQGFNARFCATGKTYAYRIWTHPVRPVFERRYVNDLGQTLDVAAMQTAAAALVGTHDFAAFCAAGSAVKSTVRTIRRSVVEEKGKIVEIVLEADGFLYNMVRIISGTLIEVGMGRMPSNCLETALTSLNRSEAGPTAPPQGLCLQEVYFSRANGQLIARK